MKKFLNSTWKWSEQNTLDNGELPIYGAAHNGHTDINGMYKDMMVNPF